MNDHVHGLGTGLAGTLLRRAVLARGGSAWEAVHRIAHDVSTQPATVHADHAGLYRGAPALAYALHTAGHPAYCSALESLDETISGLVRAKLARARERMAAGQPPRMREYDLISGLTGLGAYLLHRRTHPELLEHLLRYVVQLLRQPVTVGGRTVPGWWTSDSPNGQPDEAWPYGHGNFGLAHGVAGPVALLALCARAGFRVPRQQQALMHACRLLEQWASPVPAGGMAWPETVTADRWHQGPPSSTAPGRPSWCYGTPGIARALQMAALACNRASGQRHAEHALAVCLTDPAQLGSLTDATVCHGWAGLALTVAAAAADAAPDSPLPGQAPLLRDRLAAHIQRHPMTDTPGLLTGSDGILLTLCTLTPTRRVAPVWETCLLLN